MAIMAGKVCTVTGGAGALVGRAPGSLQEGAKVMLVGRNEENLLRGENAERERITGDDQGECR